MEAEEFLARPVHHHHPHSDRGAFLTNSTLFRDRHQTSVFRTAPARTEKHHPTVSETCHLCNGPFRPRFVAPLEGIPTSLANGFTDWSEVQWRFGLDRRDKPGGSSEGHRASSRQQHAFCGACLFLPFPSFFETKKRPRRILGRSVVEPALVDNVRRRGRVQSGATGQPRSQTIRMDRCSLRRKGRRWLRSCGTHHVVRDFKCALEGLATQARHRS